MPVRLTLATGFGPFTDLTPTTLPDFSVLTGLNGSGKTQLLRAIAAGQIVVDDDAKQISPTAALYVQQLVPHLNLLFPITKAEQIENEFVNILRASRGLRGRVNRHRVGQPAPAQAPPVRPRLDAIATILAKTTSDLLEEEVEAYAVAVASSLTTEHFRSDIAAVSMGHLRTHYHQMRALRVREAGDSSLDALLDSSRSVASLAPPWALISDVLSTFGFRIEGPLVNLASGQRDLQLVMRDLNGRITQPQSLSGGEQSLLALALAQYTTAVGGRFPEILLLDECLSALHPSIISKALRVVDDVFVKKNGTRVILVTHAPTVVALAPPDATFVVEKDDARLIVRKAAKDECWRSSRTA